jgi:nucleoside-diphosphate-sugar epimerase
MTGHLLCFGLGYTAQHVIKQLEHNYRNGMKISATARTLISSSAKVHIFDELLAIPHDITHLLISIPPQDNMDLVLKTFGLQLAKLQSLKWCGYLSSTGVYGDHQGAWVNEESETIPNTLNNRNRLEVEGRWMEMYHKLRLPVHIFRLAGIYGLGRSALDTVQRGKAYIIDDPKVLFSRIYIKDLVTALISSMNHPTPGEIYNLADDEPASPAEVIAYACKCLNIDPPKPQSLEEACAAPTNLSPMARSFYLSSKKISNAKVKSALGWKPLYPSYVDGIYDILHNHNR